MSDDENQKEDLPFRAEYAKSGKSSCKECKGKIKKGELRLAIMVPFFLLLIHEVSGGDHVHHDQLQPHHHNDHHEPCSPLRLSKCSDLLTRALDKHDFGFVTTELGLNSLCELVYLPFVIVIKNC